MTDQNITGEWHLVASISIQPESHLEFLKDGPDHTGISNWLNGFDDKLIEEAQETSGLVLCIKQDGSFTEEVTGNPNVYWFNDEGCLVDVAPFNGVLVETEQGFYLKPTNINEWAIPIEEAYGACVLRYDDGDTKITDHLRRVGEYLVRTVNVVTDEAYLDRVLIKYKRDS